MFYGFDATGVVLLYQAALLIVFGLIKLRRALHARRLRRLDAAYRASALVINAGRILRAAQHRAQEREWGRAP